MCLVCVLRLFGLDQTEQREDHVGFRIVLDLRAKIVHIWTVTLQLNTDSVVLRTLCHFSIPPTIMLELHLFNLVTYRRAYSIFYVIIVK